MLFIPNIYLLLNFIGYVCKGTLTKLPDEMLTSELSCSPLWEESVRELVKTSKMSESDLNKLRSHQLIPGRSKIIMGLCYYGVSEHQSLATLRQ